LPPPPPPPIRCPCTSPIAESTLLLVPLFSEMRVGRVPRPSFRAMALIIPWVAWKVPVTLFLFCDDRDFQGWFPPPFFSACLRHGIRIAEVFSLTRPTLTRPSAFRIPFDRRTIISSFLEFPQGPPFFRPRTFDATRSSPLYDCCFSPLPFTERPLLAMVTVSRLL